jgi:hypothetical protein
MNIKMEKNKIFIKLNFLIIFLGIIFPLILFLNRFLIPDHSYDVINYHIFLGQRGFGFLNKNFSEFYPTGIHSFSSILEIPNFFLLKFLGYRMGTIGSLIFLYFNFLIIFKLYKLFFKNYKKFHRFFWYGFLLINIFFSFEIFMPIATYYIDLFVTLLLILSIYFFQNYQIKYKKEDLFISSFFISLAILGKISILYFIPPFLILLIWILFFKKPEHKKYFLLSLIIIFILPSFFYFKNFINTGNPIFPFLNNIFKSKYAPLNSYFINNFGGVNLLEKISWGFFSIFNPARLVEGREVFHDYKINFYFFLSLFTFFYFLFKKKMVFVSI